MDTKKLKCIMIDQEITQKELSSSIGISKNTLNQKINGKKPFNSDEIISICNVLRIESPELKDQIFLTQTS